MSGLDTPCSVCKSKKWREVKKERVQRKVSTGFMEMMMEYEVTLWRCGGSPSHLAQTEKVIQDDEDLEMYLGGIWTI